MLIIIKNIQLKNLKSQSGVAALLTIIIISAAALIIAFNASLLGLGELEFGYTSQKGGEALALAEGCAEEALRRLKFDNLYTGGTLNLTSGLCIITVNISGDDRIITSVGSVNNYYKTIRVNANISGDSVIISNWEEISS